MEDIKMKFSQINEMLMCVQSEMAAAPTTDYLPFIAEVLSKMEEMVAACQSQSESGYDTCEADVSDVLSVSSVSSSSSSSVAAHVKGDKFIDNVKTAICQLAPSGAYDAAKAMKKRKKRQAKRAQQIVPTEFLVLWQSLQEKNVVLQSPAMPPHPYPEVNWSKVNVKQKATIPLPDLFPIHGCSGDPAFYQPIPVHLGSLPAQFDRQNPFGALPGYKTNLGVIATPAHHTNHGYIYVPGDIDGWVLHATVGEQKDDKIKSPRPRSRRTRARPPRWRAGG